MNTRNRSGSLQFDDVKLMFANLEESLSSQISNVFKKIEGIERSIEAINVNQIRLDTEISSIKQVIIKQQQYIERLETEKRMNNVIVQGIPEPGIKIDDVSLTTDTEKVDYLTNIVSENGLAVDSVFRLGRKGNERSRPLVVRFSCKADRNRFLFHQKSLRENVECKLHFGTIFVNRDSTYLMRKEEKRLRDKIKAMRPTIQDDDRLYIRNDKLFLNNDVIDSIDISNQLF